MKRKIFSSILALVLVLSCVVTGCGPQVAGPGPDTGATPNESGSSEDDTFKLTYADGTVLRMATGYNNAKTGLFFDAEVAGDGITLADGKTYLAGSLKPTWVEVGNKLNIGFENQYQGNSASKEFDYWKEKLDQVDMVSGSATQLSENGLTGSLINLADYLDDMPNFKKYLEANPIVRLSITADTTNGAIYFSPYFDGVNDIERMPLMRTDWVEKLLNGEGAFAADKSGTTAAPVYEPYMPTSGTVTVDVVSADGKKVESLTKDYSKYGNIVEKMNAKGAISGVEAVNMLRDYIDKTYNGYYGTNRADLFIGQNAAWDADELVALLRCVVANAQTLNGTDTVAGLFSREDENNQRRVDMMRFAGTLFGARGLESRQDYLYVGNDGKLHDARGEGATYNAIERMNAMTQEGLVASSFVDSTKVGTETMLKTDAGFMHYDYNQTQTLYNEKDGVMSEGEKYMAVMVPVARWDDGDAATNEYMRFTESWRSVKTDGWAISAAGVQGNTDKLHAALALIDFAYSKEGQILMSYGPDAFIKTDANGEYVTFDFNGEQWPVIADATYAELWEKAKGNYTNYARQYLGSTLSFVKSQSFEYQCTTEVGREGAGYISNAIALGTIKHPELAITENAWYTSVPTVLPYTQQENEIKNGLTNLTGKSSKFSTSKGERNILVDLIAKGYAGTSEPGCANATEMMATVNALVKDGGWGVVTYLSAAETAWQKLVAYYGELTK